MKGYALRCAMIIAALALAGCATPQLQSGAPVATPVWMILYCQDSPAARECRHE